jgi:hypothetical protein
VAGVAEGVVGLGEAGLAQPARGALPGKGPEANVGRSRMADQPGDLGRHHLDAGGHQNERGQLIQAMAEVEEQLQRARVHHVSVVHADQQRGALRQVAGEAVEPVNDGGGGLIRRQPVRARGQQR